MSLSGFKFSDKEVLERYDSILAIKLKNELQNIYNRYDFQFDKMNEMMYVGTKCEFLASIKLSLEKSRLFSKNILESDVPIKAEYHRIYKILFTPIGNSYFDKLLRYKNRANITYEEIAAMEKHLFNELFNEKNLINELSKNTRHDSTYANYYSNYNNILRMGFKQFLRAAAMALILLTLSVNSNAQISSAQKPKIEKSVVTNNITESMIKYIESKGYIKTPFLTDTYGKKIGSGILPMLSIIQWIPETEYFLETKCTVFLKGMLDASYRLKNIIQSEHATNEMLAKLDKNHTKIIEQDEYLKAIAVSPGKYTFNLIQYVPKKNIKIDVNKFGKLVKIENGVIKLLSGGEESAFVEMYDFDENKYPDVVVIRRANGDIVSIGLDYGSKNYEQIKKILGDKVSMYNPYSK